MAAGRHWWILCQAKTGRYAASGPWIACLAAVLLARNAEPEAPASGGAALPTAIEAGAAGLACARCHAREAELHATSHHARATGPMSAAAPGLDETVRGDGGERVTFEVAGEGVRALVLEADGSSVDVDVVATIGVEPLQQFVARLPGGGMAILPVAWDVARGAWIAPEGAGGTTLPGDPAHWRSPARAWNLQCAECHSTGVDKAFDPATRTYATTHQALAIECEACHGSGADHAARGARIPFARGDAARELDVCAKCHARRTPIVAGHEPGARLLDHYDPALLGSGAYHADGQLREGEEAFEWGSYVQSRMYAVGVRCTDCHEPHTGLTRAPGNRLCARCHEPARFDVASHHHHAAGERGSACVDCHMPVTTYMRVDDRHDHSFRVPRPDLSIALGTPNACNACHPAESREWAREVTWKWWPKLAAAAAADPMSATGPTTPVARRERAWISLAADPRRSAFLRASAIAALADLPPTIDARAAIERAATDTEPLVRARAMEAIVRSQPRPPAELRSGIVDPWAVVRIAAARQVVLWPGGELEAHERHALARALRDFRGGLLVEADRPASHLALAEMWTLLGDHDAARAARATAHDLSRAWGAR